MNERLFVDIHVIETLPPSCVNRDDLGSPKTAVYGGVTRARVSSQAWKRAIRLEFEEMQEEIGKRTRHVSDLLTKKILDIAPDTENAQTLADNILNDVKIKTDAKKHTNNVLFFISPAQIRALAETAVQFEAFIMMEEKEKKKHKEETAAYEESRNAAIRENPSLDVALFGRMLADDPDLNLDAAAQVAHAISTHEVHNEFDYFTAVDDFEDAPGAGHLGTLEFNSATMYRYATVNAMELEKHMPGQTAHVVRAFTEAFIRSMPTGKQNSYANRVRPDAVYVSVRRDQPVNMAGAFEKPIRPGKDGFADASVKALVSYAQDTYQDYYEAPVQAFVIGNGMDELGEKVTLKDLLDSLEACLNQQLAGKVEK